MTQPDPDKVREWFRDGTLVYTLKHDRWRKNVSVKVNSTTISVAGDNAIEIAERIHAWLAALELNSDPNIQYETEKEGE